MSVIAKDLTILKRKYHNLINNHKILQFNNNNKFINNSNSNINNKMHLIYLSKANCQIENNEKNIYHYNFEH